MTLIVGKDEISDFNFLIYKKASCKTKMFNCLKNEKIKVYKLRCSFARSIASEANDFQRIP